MATSVRYFAYGSNLHPRRLAARTPSCRFEFRVTLPGHRLVFHKRSLIDGSGKCNIFHTGAADDRVWGVVYRLDAGELAALDAAEGAGGGYCRIRIAVLDERGRSHRACTYQAQADFIDDALLPLDWYRQLVVDGARHHGLPRDYILKLTGRPVMTDTELTRRRPFDDLLAGR